MADFKIELVAWWSKDGSHEVLDSNIATADNGAASEDDDDDV